MFNSELIKTDVTAVKLVNNVILAGIGNFLFIFSRSGTFLNKVRIFDGQKIHGIQVEEQNLLLHGGYHLQTLRYGNLSRLHTQKIDDWILTTRWLKDDFVALVVMKNKLIICDSQLRVVRQVACQESCILYSACIVGDSKELAVLSGTVFGQILAWKVEEQESSPVLARLMGHNGVIFSVDYNKTAGYVCSSSDDRSSILWSVESKCLLSELRRSTPKIFLSRKFYGHSSRVFRCLLSDNFLLSAGEDSIVNVWSFNGELLNKIATHQGGAVWAVDSDGTMVVAGGGGCGVLLSHIKNEPTCLRLTMPDEEVPKRIGLLQKSIVVVTEKGALYSYLRGTKTWIKVAELEELKSYSVLEVSRCRNLVSLSGYHGEMYIYRDHEDGLQVLATNPKTNIRICSFHWLSCSTFMICQDNSLLVLWFLHDKQLLEVTTFQLPPSTWTTSACQTSSRFIVGDRRGNIHVFALKTSSPVQTLKKAHTHLGVTRLQTLGKRVVSMGRDGTIKTFIWSDHLDVLSVDKLPFSWLIGRDEDLVLAFSGNVFIAWDYTTRKTLVEHLCGGGHRSWDFHDFTFAYVKERHLYVVQWDRKKIRPVSVVADFHISVINSLAVLALHDRHVVVSGSEDTTLRVSSVGKDHFRCLQNVKAHLSSIKAVCVHRVGSQHLVFSGGGRGQLICWELNVEENECRQEFSYYEKTEESETRIMDLKTFGDDEGLVLLAGCSDGTINFFRVERKTGRFELRCVRKLFHRAKCVTRLLVLQEVGVLVTMSSDGVFAFWDLHNSNVTPFNTMRLHQSGVIGCRYRFIQKNLMVLLSGGDDGCIVFSLLRIKSGTVSIVDTFRDATSHCAQVSGVWISKEFFLTTGTDQKLLVFRWCVEEETLRCTFVGRYNSAVADIQGLECDERDGGLNVFLYGKGVEYVTIDFKGMFS